MVFREEVHPRDRDGKFTDKGAGVSEGKKLRKAVSIYSDEPDKDAPPEKLPNPEKAVRFNRPEIKHHQRHAKERGFKNTRDYERAAVEFFNSDKGKLYYSLAKQRFYRYEERTKLFCASSHSEIHTFMLVTKKAFENKEKQDECSSY